MYMQKFTSQLIVCLYSNTSKHHSLAKYEFKHFILRFFPSCSFIHSLIQSVSTHVRYALVINDRWSLENTHKFASSATSTAIDWWCFCIQVPFISSAHRPPNICHFHYFVYAFFCLSLLRSPNLHCEHLCTHIYQLWSANAKSSICMSNIISLYSFSFFLNTLHAAGNGEQMLNCQIFCAQLFFIMKCSRKACFDTCTLCDFIYSLACTVYGLCMYCIDIYCFLALSQQFYSLFCCCCFQIASSCHCFCNKTL